MLERGAGPGGLVPKSRRKKAAAATRKARSRRRPAARSSRATEAALAGLAHDIRTPLTGIVALAELLNTSDLPEREARWAAAIKGAAEHLARLTTLVVDAAKAEASGIVLREELFSPRDLARSVGEALAARAEGKGLASKISIARGLPAGALGDPIRLRSALENLIDNAVKFTERGSVDVRGVGGPRRARALASPVRGDRQRHRHRRGRPQAAVQAVLAGQRGGRAALRRRRARARVRQTCGKGDGRRPHGDQHARPRQQLSSQRAGGARIAAPARPQRRSGRSRRAAFACSASRTILTAASCSTRCSASSATT